METMVVDTKDGQVRRVGIEHTRMTLLGARWSDAGLVIACRTEGGNYWAGRGMQGYSGAEVETYMVPHPDETVVTETEVRLRVIPLISTPLRTTKAVEGASQTAAGLRKRIERDKMHAATAYLGD